MAEPTRCMPVAEVARCLGVSDDVVYDLIHGGQLPGVRVGNPETNRPRLVVPLPAYEAFIEAGGVAA